jgi:magnesium-transporting ATPase (P-type)
MIKTIYTVGIFALLHKYKSDVAQYDDELRLAQGFVTAKLWSWLLIIFIGSCLLGYSALLYYKVVLFPNSSLF